MGNLEILKSILYYYLGLTIKCTVMPLNHGSYLLKRITGNSTDNRERKMPNCKWKMPGG